MAQPKWLMKYLTMKPEVTQIFDDLERLREFCVDFGHVYDERYLTDHHSHVHQDFMRWREGKHVRNQWNSRGEERKDFRPRNNNNRGYNNYRSGGYNRNA